jgi:hypothetical protein
VIEQLHEVIQEIEHKWAAKRLLVVGDVMLDKYIWGDVGASRRRRRCPWCAPPTRASSRAARPTWP